MCAGEREHIGTQLCHSASTADVAHVRGCVRTAEHQARTRGNCRISRDRTRRACITHLQGTSTHGDVACGCISTSELNRVGLLLGQAAHAVHACEGVVVGRVEQQTTRGLHVARQQAPCTTAIADADVFAPAALQVGNG